MLPIWADGVQQMDVWRVIEIFPRDGGWFIVVFEKQDARLRVGSAVVSNVTNYSTVVRHLNTDHLQNENTFAFT
jgi:hypothetical protein